MHEILHKWLDGYGAELTLTYMPDMPTDGHAAYALVSFTTDAVDVFVDAHDLRSMAAAVLAMAEQLEAADPREGGNE